LYQQEKGDAGIIQFLLLVIESANGVRYSPLPPHSLHIVIAIVVIP
jgi:hypothetical protein